MEGKSRFYGIRNLGELRRMRKASGEAAGHALSSAWGRAELLCNCFSPVQLLERLSGSVGPLAALWKMFVRKGE